MSTPHTGGNRPSVVSTGKKPPPDGDSATSATKSDDSATKSGGPAAKSGGSATKSGGSATKSGGTGGTGGRAGGRPATRSAGGKGPAGKGPRRPIKPVKVSQGRSWGPIGLLAAVIAVALVIVGYAAWYVWQGSVTWQERAADIPGLTDFRASDPQGMASGQHQNGTVQYPMSPPVGGTHNFVWQNCNGDVYTEPIASEHAVHSLEHGAVWVTYRPDLPADQVATLAAKVRGKEKIFMSPYEGLDRPVSLQAWGYQLKVDSATDKRVDDFIRALRVNASMEGPTATCAGGITVTGTTPRDIATQ